MELPDIIKSDLIYRRQYYDAETSTMRCRFCGTLIRQVFLLKTPHNATITIGSCCFFELKEANPTVYTELVASLVLLRGYVRDTQTDSTEHKQLGAVFTRKLAYKALRQAAVTQIRTFRKTSGEKEWLPKPLFELNKELQKRPRKRYNGHLPLIRWYSMHTNTLQRKLDSCRN